VAKASRARGSRRPPKRRSDHDDHRPPPGPRPGPAPGDRRNHAPGIETLETRNSDRLDFHDISAAAIRGMLRDAFELGIAAALDNNKRSR
jgi:hypothetical protein